jgi:hypothetical protein
MHRHEVGACELAIGGSSTIVAVATRPNAEVAVQRIAGVVVHHRVFLSVSAPQLSMPPPPASANPHGRSGQIDRTLGTVTVGATRLRAMALSATS